MNYNDLDNLLQGRCANSRKLARNTYAKRREGGKIAIMLHETDIATFSPSGAVTLDSGGHKTATTKERINSFTPLHVWQERGLWTVSVSGSRSSYHYADGMTIKPSGKVIGAAADPLAKRKADEKAVKAYVSGFVDALCAGDVPEPSGGDCWLCCLGKHDDHVREHMKDGYYVPRLLVSALDQAKVGDFHKGYIGQLWTGHRDSLPDWCIDATHRALRKYMWRALGYAV